jgi:RNA polymerase sigma-70 factor (ECF subfamily)
MSNPSPETDPSQWVDEHGDALFRYALLRLRDAEQAEDVVQETLVAALQARASFAGRSSLRTWLIGILKRKIVDHIRKRSRERPISELEVADEETDIAEEMFSRGEHIMKNSSEWPNPREVLRDKQFMAILHQCLAALPERLANAFILREMEQEKSDEVCKVLEITPSNLWVMLFRARTRLRGCLDENWFDKNKRT